MIDEPRFFLPQALSRKNSKLIWKVMAEISHPSYLRCEKLNLASKVSMLTTVWYDQMAAADTILPS